MCNNCGFFHVCVCIWHISWCICMINCIKGHWRQKTAVKIREAVSFSIDFYFYFFQPLHNYACAISYLHFLCYALQDCIPFSRFSFIISFFHSLWHLVLDFFRKSRDRSQWQLPQWRICTTLDCIWYPNLSRHAVLIACCEMFEDE